MPQSVRRTGAGTSPRGARLAEATGLVVLAFALAVLAMAVERARLEALRPIAGMLVLGPAQHSLVRAFTVAACIGLLLVARGLARGQRRAWWAALVLLAVIALATSTADVDQVSAVSAAVLLVVLLALHRTFTALSDPPPRHTVAGFVLLAAVALYGYGMVATYWYAHDEHLAWRPAVALSQVSWSILGQDSVPHPTHFDTALTVTLCAAAVITAVILVALILRSPLSGVTRSARDRATVRRIVREHGDDTLSYFALRRDKRHFINEERSAFIAYRGMRGVAIVSGDPVGDDAALPALVADFAAFCRGHSWRPAVIGVAAERRRLWESVGLKALPVGEEAIVHPASFSLEGRAVRKVRQSVNRLARLGYTARILPAADVTPELWQEIERVSEVWTGGLPERGFSMALDDMHDPQYGDCLFVLGMGPGGALEGFLHFAPVPATGDLSLSAMRRLPDTPNGFNEFLISTSIEWAKARGIAEVSLNFAAFGGLLRDESEAAPARAARSALRYADRFFQLERLVQFNSKFQPEWRPRYLAVERALDVPVAGFALLSLEGLVRVPWQGAGKEASSATGSVRVPGGGRTDYVAAPGFPDGDVQAERAQRELDEDGEQRGEHQVVAVRREHVEPGVEPQQGAGHGGGHGDQP